MPLELHYQLEPNCRKQPPAEKEMRKQTHATLDEVFKWLMDGIFILRDNSVFSSNGKELAQRINKRRGSERGDLRIDLCYENKRRSINVSWVVWMVNSEMKIPEGNEIHHIDEDPTNNEWTNLICLTPEDHQKLHNKCLDDQFLNF